MTTKFTSQGFSAGLNHTYRLRSSKFTRKYTDLPLNQLRQGFTFHPKQPPSVRRFHTERRLGGVGITSDYRLHLLCYAVVRFRQVALL